MSLIRQIRSGIVSRLWSVLTTPSTESMTDTSDPYLAPDGTADVFETPRRYTPGQCAVRFLVVGAFAGGLSGFATLLIPQASFATLLLPPGVIFGIALWWAVWRFIGPVTPLRMLILIGGCLAGFTVTGTVIQFFVPISPFQPWSWTLLRPGVYSSAAGVTLIVMAVRAAGGSVRWPTLLITAGMGTLSGTASYCVYTELEALRMSPSECLFVTLVLCESAMFGLIGLQLSHAAANHHYEL